eukprot:2092742-Pyramimonas_sp.AAC.1
MTPAPWMAAPKRSRLSTLAGWRGAFFALPCSADRSPRRLGTAICNGASSSQSCLRRIHRREVLVEARVAQQLAELAQ